MSEFRVVLTVEDVDAALRFYRDALGLTVEESWDRPDGRGAVVAGGRATLELIDERNAETADRVEVGRRTGGELRLALEVPDSAEMAARLAGAGAEVLGGPVDTPWGHRSVRVRTPDGTQLTLFTVP